jgi:hypothetical protein
LIPVGKFVPIVATNTPFMKNVADVPAAFTDTPRLTNPVITGTAVFTEVTVPKLLQLATQFPELTLSV